MMGKKKERKGSLPTFDKKESGAISSGYHREVQPFIGADKKLDPVPSGRPRHEIGDKKRKVWAPFT
jgi:hypothetical protein